MFAKVLIHQINEGRQYDGKLYLGNRVFDYTLELKVHITQLAKQPKLPADKTLAEKALGEVWLFALQEAGKNIDVTGEVLLFLITCFLQPLSLFHFNPYTIELTKHGKEAASEVEFELPDETLVPGVLR